MSATLQYLLLGLLLIAACVVSAIATETRDEWAYIPPTHSEVLPAQVPPPPQPAPRDEARVELSSSEVPLGETLVVEIFGDITILRMGAERIPFSRVGGQILATIGFDTRAVVGPRILTYESTQGTGTTTFAVLEKEYAVTRIVVPPKLAAQGVTSGELVASIAKSDNVTLTDMVAIETEAYQFTEPFLEPTEEWVDVGGFGTVREDQNGSIRHLGVDLDGRTGDPVYATNRGVVVYAGELENFGKSVVIDHGVGIFSIYLHLSAISTEAGKTVAAHDRIGAIGNSGAYTLAPHLHFSIKVRGVSVDPRSFIDTFASVLVP